MEPPEGLLALQGLVKAADYPRYQAEIPEKLSGLSLERAEPAVSDARDDRCIFADVPAEYRELSGISFYRTASVQFYEPVNASGADGDQRECSAAEEGLYSKIYLCIFQDHKRPG